MNIKALVDAYDRLTPFPDALGAVPDAVLGRLTELPALITSPN
ncbi:MAG: hypothetical protein Q8L40_01380 [Burkholderiales bacterium]|nr:hypothetical protein [Burkholderiales bacterium]